MLQPRQLEDVSSRYANEIAELGDFFSKAGCRIGTVASLGEITARLRSDRAFHRDLTSHLLVIIHQHQQISYSDLLGLLAIAAAGASFAAAAEEDDAHDLLQFLIEARRSSDIMAALRKASSEPMPVRREPVPAPEPVPSAAYLDQEILQSELLQSGLPVSEVPESPVSTGKRINWVAIVCVIVAVLAGLSLCLWLAARYTNQPVTTVPVTTTSPALSVETNNSAVPSDSYNSSPARNPVPSAQPTERVRHVLSARHDAGSLQADPSSASSAITLPTTTDISPRAITPPQTMAFVPSPATALRSVASIPSASPNKSRGANSNNRTVPIETLQKQLGTQPANGYSPNDDSADVPGHPRLHRRPQISSVSGTANQRNLIAANNSVPPSPAAINAARAGIVHSTSLGIMGGNLIYSPDPAYPPTAAIAHQQGEVRIEATVDRQGNVTSTRIISGPPLLRDAALDAVQRWRFRPYVSQGKPVAATAVAVVDFQLP